MFRKTHVAAIALLVAGYALPSAQSVALAGETFGDPQDVKQITAIEDTIAVETNVDKLIPYYADDAVLVDINAPGFYQGKKQIYAASQASLGPLKDIKYRMDEISVASDGKFGCAAMLLHFDVTKKDNTTFKMSIRQLDAFKKIDGQWRIVQQHLSVPVDQKTATPLIDAPVNARGPLAWSAASHLGAPVPVDQAKKEISDWLWASEVPKNITEMMGYYGPGDDNIVFDWWSSHEVRGQKEIHDFYGPTLVGVKDLKIKIPVAVYDTDGAFGLEVSQQHLKEIMDDGTTHLISFRQSDCVRRVNGKWYSFFEMGSFPVDPKTGKAIMADAANSGFN